MSATPDFITMGDGSRKRVSPATFAAFEAFSRGRATPGQQKTVMAFWTHEICGVLDVPSGHADPRASAFADGARWAGITVLRLCDSNPVAVLRRLGEPSDGSDNDS